MAAPKIAWHNVTAEFASEVQALDATAVSGFRPQILNRCRSRRALKLDEARPITVRNGFAALAAGGHALPDDLAIRLANRFTAYREEEMFVFPRAHDAIDEGARH